jgi:hypothetical protein
MKRLATGSAIIVGVVVLGALHVRSKRPTYPYGPSHCCLKGLGLVLHLYAEEHDGKFPAGAGSPEASLSLLYQENSGADAELLRGKTVPLETVKKILESGELLGPDSCGWHYVEGLTLSDDLQLAIVWDKVGLGHNGQDIQGGHSVLFLGGSEDVVTASEWPEFLKRQEQLMAARHNPDERDQREKVGAENR